LMLIALIALSVATSSPEGASTHGEEASDLKLTTPLQVPACPQ